MNNAYFDLILTCHWALLDVLIGNDWNWTFKNKTSQIWHYFRQWHTRWSTAEDATGYIHDWNSWNDSVHAHFEVLWQTWGSDLLRREKDSSHQGATEAKVKYSLRPITGGGPEDVQVCEGSETASGKMEQSTAEPESVWGSPARRPVLGGSHWKPICGWKCSSPGVHSHRETRPVIKGARGQDGPLIWGCREKGDQHWCICSQTMAITFLFIWRRGGFERAIWGAEEMARHRISGTTGR